MSEREFDEAAAGRSPVGYVRFVPAVTFGLRAAALAGLAVSAGAMAVGLIDGQAGIVATYGWAETTSSTCCGGEH